MVQRHGFDGDIGFHFNGAIVTQEALILSQQILN
jgi:hypothetical protein